mmetsp:Transcript_37253/g.92664  ORF Transcript_37253/g.92664 Transcript_37253/m.92664 type:complete len:105 (+) Transcript_37253:276-590(+)
MADDEEAFAQWGSPDEIASCPPAVQHNAVSAEEKGCLENPCTAWSAAQSRRHWQDIGAPFAKPEHGAEIALPLALMRQAARYGVSQWRPRHPGRQRQWPIDGSQ